MNDCPRLPADRRGKTEEYNKWVNQLESIVNDDPEFRNKVVHTTYERLLSKTDIYDCNKKALCDYNRDVYFLMNRLYPTRVRGPRRGMEQALDGRIRD
jgi:hypothetical protein